MDLLFRVHVLHFVRRIEAEWPLPELWRIVYLVMNYVVIPLSRTSTPGFNPAWFTANFGGHILLVGLPVALIAHRSATARRF